MISRCKVVDVVSTMGGIVIVIVGEGEGTLHSSIKSVFEISTQLADWQGLVNGPPRAGQLEGLTGQWCPSCRQ